MRLGRTALVHFFSQVGSSVAGFVATFVIARELGPAALGVYAVGVGLIYVTGIPTHALGTATNKRVSEGTEQAAYLSAGVILNVAVSGGAATILVVFRPQVNGFVGADVAVLLAGVLFVQSLYTSTQNALNGLKMVERAGLVEVTERVTRTILQIGLVLLGYRVTGLFIGYVGSLVVAIALGALLVRLWPRRPSIRHIRGIAVFAKYSWLSKVQARSFGWTDTIVLAFFVSSSLIGIYEVAWTLSTVFALLGRSIQQTLFPEVSHLGTRGDYERVRHYLDEAMVYGGFFAIPGIFGAIILGPRVLSIYRPEFAAGGSVLVVLIIAQLATVYANQVLGVIDALDRPDVTFRINLAFLVVNVVLNVVLIVLVGWRGAAVATALASICLFVGGATALSGIIGNISIPYRELVMEFLAAVVMGGIVLSLKSIFPTGHVGTGALIVVGVAAYFSVVFALSSRVRDKVRYVFSA